MAAFCTTCGTSIEPHDRFCAGCGRPAESAGSPPGLRPGLPAPAERSGLVRFSQTGEVMSRPSLLPEARREPPFETAWPELAAAAAERGQQRALVNEMRSRAQWAQVALIFTSLAILLFVGALAYEVSWLSDMQEWQQRSRPGGGLIAYDAAGAQLIPQDLIEREGRVYQFMTGATGWLSTALVVTTILLLRWVHGTWRDALNRDVRVPTWSPGWAVAWWFVPFVNLWMPFRVMSWLWSAGHLGIDGAPPEPPGRPFVMWAWWLVTVPATFIFGLFWGFRRSLNSESGAEVFHPTFRLFILVDQITLVAAVTWFVGGVFLWLTIRRVMKAPRWDLDRIP